jgi:glyoxylase-like metal-dependent hydrolase (beta-lactamase superfamily II)
MIVSRTTVGPFEENAYLAVDEATGRAVFIDPGAEGERLVEVVRKSGATLDAIWLTHAHVDHIGGVAALRRVYDVPILLHPFDQPVYAAGDQVARKYGIPFDVPPAVDAPLSEGHVLQVGDARFEVLHVPGHAPGHVLFVGPDMIFGGDLIFAGSIGRTDLPLSNPADMHDSLVRAATLAPSLALHPGHGRSTSIGDELRTNPFLSGAARVIHSGAR